MPTPQNAPQGPRPDGWVQDTAATSGPEASFQEGAHRILVEVSSQSSGDGPASCRCWKWKAMCPLLAHDHWKFPRRGHSQDYLILEQASCCGQNLPLSFVRSLSSVLFFFHFSPLLHQETEELQNGKHADGHVAVTAFAPLPSWLESGSSSLRKWKPLEFSFQDGPLLFLT